MLIVMAIRFMAILLWQFQTLRGNHIAIQRKLAKTVESQSLNP